MNAPILNKKLAEPPTAEYSRKVKKKTSIKVKNGLITINFKG